MSIQLYLAYVLACFLVVIVPGPTVTVIIANSLRHGTSAGLLNIVGTQLGLATLMAIVRLRSRHRPRPPIARASPAVSWSAAACGWRSPGPSDLADSLACG